MPSREQLERQAAEVGAQLDALAGRLRTALQRRRTAIHEHLSVLNRLGRPTDGADYPSADLGPAEDHIAAAVQRLVAERTDADAADLAVRREAAITTETKGTS